MAIAARDGIELFYVDEDAGEPPVLLVPGWCCDHRFFAPQHERLRATHRTVGVDLRGHGASSAPEGPYAIETFAGDLAWLCRELGLARPVVVGHSMGAQVALALAAAEPDLPSALVLVDPAPLAVTGELAGTIEQLVGGLRSPSFRKVRDEFLDSGFFFLESDDPARRAWIAEAMSATPQHVAAAALEGIGAYAAAERLPVTLPVLAVLAASPQVDPGQLAAFCTDLTVAHTPDVGHFNQLLAAEEVSDLIAAFVAARAHA